MLWNCSTLSRDVLLTLLCNFTYNFAYQHPKDIKRCETPKIECYTSQESKQSTMVPFDALELLNSLHRCAPHTFVQFCAQLRLFASLFIKRCETPNIECYTFQDTKQSTMVHFNGLELLNALHRCVIHTFVQFYAQLRLFTSLPYETQ